MLNKPTYNDTFSKARPEEVSDFFLIKEDTILFCNESKYKPENRLGQIRTYRKWFWNRINHDDVRVRHALEGIITQWSTNQRLCFACDAPELPSYHDVLIEYLSWVLWKANTIDGHIFTTENSRLILR